MRNLKNAILYKCTTEGYIDNINEIVCRGSIKKINKDLSGNFYVNVWFNADVINYETNDIIYGLTVDRIDKYGIHASNDRSSKMNLNVYIEAENLPMDYAVSYQTGDTINIVVFAVKCNPGNRDIRIIGKQLYYYSVYPLNELVYSLYTRTKETPPVVDINNIQINTSDTRPLPDDRMGYNDIYEETVVNVTNSLEPSTLQFMRSLCNPLELVYSDNKDYSDISMKLNKKAGVTDREYYELTEVLQNFDIIPDSIADKPIDIMVANTDSEKAVTLFREAFYEQSDDNIIVDPDPRQVPGSTVHIYVSDYNANNEDLLNSIISTVITSSLESVILPLSDLYDNVTAEIISLLTYKFSNVSMFKPRIVSLDDPKRYIIANGNNPVPNNIVTALKGLQENLLKLSSDTYVSGIFNDSNSIESILPYIYNANKGFQEKQHNKYIEIRDLHDHLKRNDMDISVETPLISRYYECQKGMQRAYLEDLEL